MKEFRFGVKLFLYLQWLLYAAFLVLLFINYGSSTLTLLKSPLSLILCFIMTLSIILSDIFPIVYSIDSSENKAEITVSYALEFAIAFIFMPLEAAIICFLGTLISEIIVKRQWFKMLFNATKDSLTVGLISILFLKLYTKSLPFLAGKNILVILLASIIYFLIDSTILFALLALINEQPLPRFWIKNIVKIFPTLISLFLLGIIIIFFFQTEPLMNLFIIPTFIAVYLALKREVQITQETENTLYALADAVDARIPDTMDHSKRVAILTRDLCNALNVDDERTNIIVMAAKLHDIGKVIIPDKILYKAGKLTEEEYDKVKSHSNEGAKIASSLSKFRKGATFIKFHHERFNGEGYPNGLQAENIPLGARIITIADSFDTMTTPRFYRMQPKTIEEAFENIKNNKGTQFDPYIADVFIQMVKEKKEKYAKIIEEAKDKFEGCYFQQQ